VKKLHSAVWPLIDANVSNQLPKLYVIVVLNYAGVIGNDCCADGEEVMWAYLTNGPNAAASIAPTLIGY